MVYSNTNLNLEKMLLNFMSNEDPMLSMLKWLCEQLMEAEVTAKIGASKSERSPHRSGYRSGYRVRRFDTRMGTMYLFVPKLRNGGYVEKIYPKVVELLCEMYLHSYLTSSKRPV